MERIPVYCRLTLLDSISLVIITIFGFMLVVKNFIMLDISTLFVVIFIIPMVLTLIYIILDAELISHSVKTDDMFLEKYRVTLREFRRTIYMPDIICRILFTFSLILIITCIFMIILMFSKSLIEGAAIYVTILALSLCHVYMLN